MDVSVLVALTPLIVAVAIATCAFVAIATSRYQRGGRRIRTQRLGVYIAVPAVTASLVLLPMQWNIPFSDSLSLAGLLVSIVFGFRANALEQYSSRVKVGIVIPSRVPFHCELRSGFTDALSTERLEVRDDYLITSQPVENLADFLPALRRTLRWRPDYLVVCSPSVELVSSQQIANLLATFAHQGGGVVFIDNKPNDEVLLRLGSRFGFVTSDVERGARFLAQHIKSEAIDGDTILVIAGPSSSAAAKLRQRVFEEELPNSSVKVSSIGAWSEQAGYSATSQCLQCGGVPKFIVAGNDVMALGAVRALRERRKGSGRTNVTSAIRVIGYDGIARALYAIAEPDNPFAATIRTPPAAYGHEIAAMILSDSRSLIEKRLLIECVIPVGQGQLVTHDNVELFLDA